MRLHDFQDRSLSHRLATPVVASFTALALLACSSQSGDGAVRAASSAATGSDLGAAKTIFPGESRIVADPVTQSLSYNRDDPGPVLSNVKIVAVMWGSGVNETVAAEIGGFYSGITDSGYMDWLSEYNTPTAQIGRGTLVPNGILPTFTIDPTNQSTILSSQGDVPAELASQINAGNLPTPDANTLYMVHFPPRVSIDLKSCQPGGYCARHTWSSQTIFGVAKPIYYAVLPDFGQGGGCDRGCGTGTMMQNFEMTAAHEIAEAVTDPNFHGWKDSAGNEIGDLCNELVGTIYDRSTPYAVTRLWSNEAGYCTLDGDPRAIAPASRGPGLVDVFYRSSDGDLHTNGFNASWGGDTSLGSFVDSAPGAVASNGFVSTLARGTDQALYIESSSNGSWSSGFAQIGPGELTDSPVAVSDTPGRVEVFVRGKDEALYWKWSDASHPFGVYQLVAPGRIVGKPAVVSREGNSIDVFVRGTDNRLYTGSWDGQSWTAKYFQLGTEEFRGDPAAVSGASNRLDVFVRGTDDRLYTKTWKDESWSPAYGQLGTARFQGSPAAASWGPNRIDVFVRSAVDTLYTQSWDGTGWNGFSEVAPQTFVGSPAVVSPGPNLLRVFVRGSEGQGAGQQGVDGELYVNSWTGSPPWTGYQALTSTPLY